MNLYSLSDDDLVEKLNTWYKHSKDMSKDWRTEARNNYDFYSGKQWTQEEQSDMEEELRNAVTFNRIGPLVDAVVGHQINNRAEIRFLPRQVGDVQISEVLTGAGKWVEDEADTQDEEEEIFQDLLITGMGWSECRMSYDEDPDGQLIPGERFSPLEAFWDPNAKRRNLADAKWRARGRWMDRSHAEAKWPLLKKRDFSNDQYTWHDMDDEAQEEPHNAARAHFYENDSRQWYNRHKDEVFIVHFQWWEYKPLYRVGDPSGRILEFDEKRFSKIKEYVESNQIPFIKQDKKCFYYAFVAGPYILEKEENPYKDGFTLQAVTGKRDEQKNCFFGIVRPLIDPQKWSNKFLSDLQDMIVSNRQGGAFVEISALINPRQAEDDWNKPNPLIQVNDGALSRGAIQERTPPQLPPALDRMIEWCVSAIPAVSGINQEFMGYTDREQPNVLEIQRKKSAVNVLATMFSSLRKYRVDRARVMLHMIREYMNDGRLIRVLGGDGTEQFIPLALDPQNKEYDIVIDEATSSPNQKEETFSVMMAMAPYLTQAGISPPLELLDYLPIPASFAAKWKEQLTPKPNPEAEEQKQLMKQAAVTDIREKQTESQFNEARARKEMAEAIAQELENEAVRLGIVSIEDI
ncbi:MAG: hypothetical protein ACO22U_13525 [bacterium]|jgi:hypothetical protein